jgi:hypothetical protein
MGGECSTCGGEIKCVQISVGKPEGKKHLEHPDIEGRIIVAGSRVGV